MVPRPGTKSNQRAGDARRVGSCDDAEMNGVLPGAEPFTSDAGPTGVLLCHGFTGSPRTLRPWAEYLTEAGLSVSLPRLPGHGTTWQDLNRTGWTDWYAEVERAFDELAARSTQVFVFGLSMGGCLALRLAQTRADAVAGLVVVNPSLAPDTRMFVLAPVLKHLIRSLPGVADDIKKPGASEGGYTRVPTSAAATLPALWKATTAGLRQVRQPLLVYRSTVDHVVGPPSMRVLRDALPDVEVRELRNSYHVATLDNDAPEIFSGSLGFIRKYVTDSVNDSGV
jgi:carboxylesterase